MQYGHVQGKGIADQDRNILANQVLLLGFLRSAAAFLETGPIPSAHLQSRRKARQSDSDAEDEEFEADTVNTKNASESSPSRGTILVTLRNVPPYTSW